MGLLRDSGSACVNQKRQAARGCDEKELALLALVGSVILMQLTYGAVDLGTAKLVIDFLFLNQMRLNG